MDEAQGMSASVDNTAPVTPAPAPQPAEAPVERRFSQVELNGIVKREKDAAIESYKRSQINSSNAASTQPQNHAGLDERYVKDLIAKETQRLQEEARTNDAQQYQQKEAQDIANEFFNKLSTGKQKYADFDDVMDGVDYSKFYNAVHLATKYADNTADIMYELGKDRTKMAAIEQLSRLSPQDAVKQIQRLSAALKANENAAQTKYPNEPLSQIRPGNNGTNDGRLSVSDYRRKYKV